MKQKTWSNGILIDGKKSVDSLNYSLHYSGTSAWEGIRSYLQSDGSTRIFKLDDHIKRLFDTAKIMGFEIPFSQETIKKACQEVVEANGGGDLYLRPIAYADYDAEAIRPLLKTISVDVYAFPIPPLHPKASEGGITMAISNLVRCYPQHQMQAKTAANYQIVQLSEPLIKSLGVDDIFVLDSQGYITEATVANVLVVSGDLITTPPNDGSILPGLTRRTMAEIIQDPMMQVNWGLTPRIGEKKITKADLYTADAVLLCGTYAEVVNVKEIDGRKLPGSKYYDILKKEYSQLTRNSKN